MAFKPKTNLPYWRQLSPAYVNGAAITAGVGWMAEDLRNNGYQDKRVFFFQSTGIIDYYDTETDSWGQLTGTFGGVGGSGAGAVLKLVPSLSPSGVLAIGTTADYVTLTTALPAAVATDQAKGHFVRIIGNGVGGNGKTEIRRITGNSSGTTPVLSLDAPLSNINVAGDGYEFLSGSLVAFFTGALAAGQFRALDLLTLAASSLATTGAIATVPATGNLYEVTDEGYVSFNKNTYEGFLTGSSTYDSGTYVKNCLLSTAIAATTITGQAVAGDVAVTANQFRNKMIHIVEDTVNTTAVGQRARIVSHTAGASPVYTIQIAAGGWTTVPSANCKFLIENWTDNIVIRYGGSATCYNYTLANNYTNINTGNTFNTTTWAASGSAAQAQGAIGCFGFGLVCDVNSYVNNSKIFFGRGGSSGAPTFDVLDMSAAATGAWTNGVTMLGNSGITVTAFDQYAHAYNPHTQEGKYLYFFPQSASAFTGIVPRPFIRFNLASGLGETYMGIPDITGSNALSSKMAWVHLNQVGAVKTAYFNTGLPLSGSKFYQTETQI